MDAVSLDATHTYIAGKCGLVPVVTENYGETSHGRLKSLLNYNKKKLIIQYIKEYTDKILIIMKK